MSLRLTHKLSFWKSSFYLQIKFHRWWWSCHNVLRAEEMLFGSDKPVTYMWIFPLLYSKWQWPTDGGGHGLHHRSVSVWLWHTWAGQWYLSADLLVVGVRACVSCMSVCITIAVSWAVRRGYASVAFCCCNVSVICEQGMLSYFSVFPNNNHKWYIVMLKMSYLTKDEHLGRIFRIHCIIIFHCRVTVG